MDSLAAFRSFIKPYDDAMNKGYGINIRKHAKKVTWLLRKDEIQHIEGVLNGHLRALSIYNTALSQYVVLDFERVGNLVMTNSGYKHVT